MKIKKRLTGLFPVGAPLVLKIFPPLAPLDADVINLKPRSAKLSQA